jgi:hypothetical protein
MAKAKAPDDSKLLEGVEKALKAGGPVRLTTSGKNPGLFPSGKAGQELARRAIELGYMEECDGPPPDSKKKATKTAAAPHGRITPKGREWFLQQTSPRQAVEALLTAFRQQSQTLQADDPDVGVLREQLGNLTHGLDEVRQAVLGVTERRLAERSRILDTLHTITETVQRSLNAEPAPQTSTALPPPPANLEPEVSSFVREWRQRRGADCPLPELYRHLKVCRSGLTIGAFHDLMRSMDHRNLIQLTGWGGSLDRMPDPEFALFISTKVMYYAHTPAPVG